MTESVLIQIIIAASAVTVALLSAAAVYFSRQTHRAVNSRMEKMMEICKEKFKAEGAKEEREAEAERKRKRLRETPDCDS